MSDFNQRIIDEFRTNGGKVGGPFAGGTLLLLTTTGAKSGEPRISPLAYTKDGEHFIIIASAAGSDINPAWYHNLRANPLVTVEVGTETFQAHATVPEEPERTRLFDMMVQRMPGFGDYQRKTRRQIPVVVLERVA